MGYTLKHFQGHPYPSPYCGRQTPYGRDTKGAKCPAVGTNEEGKSLALRIVPNQHCSSVHSLHNRVVTLSAILMCNLFLLICLSIFSS